MIDFEKTIISQFANSPIIVELITDMNDYIDQATNFDNFIKYIWNVDTAVGFGLDIWGRIVAIPRVLEIDNSIDCFGFEETDKYWQPFNQAPFYPGSSGTTPYVLSDEYYRRLIITKAMANISICSAPALNQLLKNFFPNRGNCYTVDSGGMAMKYKFDFVLEPFEIAAVQKSGAFPHPSGVAVTLEYKVHLEMLDTLEMIDTLEML
jgi:hypothetical protein